MVTPSGDSYLHCSRCGRESTTSFASSLRSGWEKCCGYTMTLVRTDADVLDSVRKVAAEQAPLHPAPVKVNRDDA